MATEIAERELLDRGKGLGWWLLGLLSMVALTVGVWPSLEGSEQMQEVIDSYPDALLALMGGAVDFDLTSATNFVDYYLFAFMLPILVVIYAIGFGARAIAGEQELDRLDLVLSYPVTRRSYALQKASVLVLLLALFSLFVLATLAVGGGMVDLGLGLYGLAAACTNLVLMCLFFGLVALAAGAISLRRSTALALAAGVTVLTYLVDSFSAIASWLDPLRPISPWYWYRRGEPLENGLDWTAVAVLLAISAIALAVAVAGFERRDLTS